MENHNLLEVAKLVLQKSLKREIVWLDTSRDKEYKLELQKALITIDKWVDDNNVNCISITLYNEKGIIIEKLENSSFSSAEYKILAQLHSEATKIANGADETFKSILSELSTDEKVGSKSTKIMRNDNIDDLPF
jgi:hypothetical protein